jgi:ABC-type nitrate/sulfonate/bicarbonate transport system permease component
VILQKRLLAALALSAGIAILWWLAFYANVAIDTDRSILGTLGEALPCLVYTTANCALLQGVQPDPFLVYSPLVFLVPMLQFGAFALAVPSLSQGWKIAIYRIFALEVIILQWWVFSSTNTLIPSPGETWTAGVRMACELTPQAIAARIVQGTAPPAGFWGCFGAFTETRLWHATFGIEETINGTVRQLGSVVIYFLGFGLAAFVGIFVGLILGGFRPLGRTMEVYVNALMATPRIAFIPLITVILGIFWEAKIFIIFLGAIMPIIVNTYAGVLNADGELVEMAKSSGASRGQIFRRILLPGSLPFIVVGLRLGATIGLINTVVAELYVSVSGLGGLLSEYRGSFRMANYAVIVVVLAIIGIFVTQGLRYVETRMDRWRYSSR